MPTVETVYLNTDLLIIGGGAAGCQAAIRAKELQEDLDVLVIEKAHVERSGCLAAGINAVNAYLNPGETPASYVEYVKKDSGGLIREDLTLTIGQRLNAVTGKLESYGLPFQKDDQGNYVPRGKRSVKINGERIKPILAQALAKSGAKVLNRVVAVDYLVEAKRVIGVVAFSVRKAEFYVIRAKATICATGGAAGLYKPNNDGASRHKMWYSPFNTGAGLAMGLRAGAQLTTLEMRFIALRTKDTISPTGTIAQGVHAPQINALGEKYQQRYKNATTPMRLYATLEENRQGRGPCYLDITHLSKEEGRLLQEAYLNMSPGMVLYWADRGIEPQERPVELCGSEPYLVGGHGQAGYWTDTQRKSTLAGLYAAGDVVGGSPKKYVTGCMAEGEIAAESAWQYLQGLEEVPEVSSAKVEKAKEKIFAPLLRETGFQPEELEGRLQKIMDEYAGGISAGYALCETKLLRAKELLRELEADLAHGLAQDLHELMNLQEVINRVLIAQALVEHLLYRKETRWPCYQERIDYPKRDDENWLKFVNSFYDQETKQFKLLERGLLHDSKD